MTCRFIIDGMNVIRTSPTLWRVEERKGIAAAQEEFLRLVRRHAQRRPDVEWIVVFDGYGEIGLEGGVECVFAHPRTADEAIVDAAIDAVAVGADVVIVSTDHAVRADGAAYLTSQEFYEDLIRRDAPPPRVADETQWACELLSVLEQKGHLRPEAGANGALVAELARQLEYLGRGRPPQKMAKKIEATLRGAARVLPSPDPEHQVARALKEFFER
ncbi:NYN domain-containing protein [bacterium]|nr:NYN domain-containing protein [bacterium]